VILLAVVPVFRDYWWKEVITGKNTDQSPKHTRTRKILTTIVFLLIIVGVGLVHLLRFAGTNADLRFLSSDDYSREITAWTQIAPSQGTLPVDTYQKMLLEQLFARASYAADHRDYGEAISVYEVLESGNNKGTPIRTFASSCVKNNLGILYYKSDPADKQRLIKAANNLLAAKDVAEKASLKEIKEQVERNYYSLTK
jgi:hypothetical protein